MQSFYFEDERGIEGAKTELFPLPGGSSGARNAPRKSFENQRGPPRWPPARLTAFLRCPVTTSMRGETLSNKTFNLTTFLKKAVFKFEVDRRLASLHFKGGSWMRRKNPSRMCSRHSPATDWPGSAGGLAQRLRPPGTLGSAHSHNKGEQNNTAQG